VIQYRKGVENGRADALSRRADYLVGNEPPRGTLLEQIPEGLTISARMLAAALKIDKGDAEARIIKAYAKDSMAKRIVKDPESFKSFIQD